MKSKLSKVFRPLLLLSIFFLLTGCGDKPAPKKAATPPQALPQKKEIKKKAPERIAVAGKRISFLNGTASLILPKGWQKGKPHGSNVIQIYGRRTQRFTANIGVLFKTLPPELAKRDLTQQERKQVSDSMIGGIRQKYPSYQLVHQGEMEIDGKQAMVFEGKVKATDAKVPMHLVQYALFKGNHFYLITAGSHESTFAAQKKLFDGVAQSFEAK